jgi:hypothetical protein
MYPKKNGDAEAGNFCGAEKFIRYKSVPDKNI